jgi:hypothetical protein
MCSTKMLSVYALQSSLHSQPLQVTPSIQVCLRGIVIEKREMKTEILSQSKSKLEYQHDLASDIIDRKHAHLPSPTTLSTKILHNDLIKNKISSMNESAARRNLFTLLKFDIKGFVNPSSIKRSALTRINVTTYGGVSSLTTKLELEITSFYATQSIIGHRVITPLATLLLHDN